MASGHDVAMGLAAFALISAASAQPAAGKVGLTIVVVPNGSLPRPANLPPTTPGAPPGCSKDAGHPVLYPSWE